MEKRTLKIRLDGQPADVNAAALRLSSIFEVIEQSDNRPKRGGSGVLRYITVLIDGRLIDRETGEYLQ